jgi:ribosome-associated protein
MGAAGSHVNGKKSGRTNAMDRTTEQRSRADLGAVSMPNPLPDPLALGYNGLVEFSASSPRDTPIVAEAQTISPATAALDSHPGLRRARAAARIAAENRGRDIVILDLRELTPVFDFFVLVSGSSRRQLHAISEEIDRVLEKELGDRRLGIEGYEESRWILLDYGDIVVHMFEPETRAYYAIEELWGQAKRVPVE